MMSQKVAPRKHTCVLPVLTRKVDKMEKLALKKTMCASWVLPSVTSLTEHSVPNLGHISKQKTTDIIYGEKMESTECLLLEYNKFIKRFGGKLTN